RRGPSGWRRARICFPAAGPVWEWLSGPGPGPEQGWELAQGSAALATGWPARPAGRLPAALLAAPGQVQRVRSSVAAEARVWWARAWLSPALVQEVRAA